MPASEILCLNPGSSSLRYARYRGEDEIASGHVSLDPSDPDSFSTALGSCLHAAAPAAVGYRVVHGGDLYSAPIAIDAAVLADLRSLVALAPQHLPAAIAAIESTRARFPEAAHIACFDTAFHRRMPEIAKRFPLPERLWIDGVRRYGFHGISFESVVAQLGQRIRPRTIIAHLGNGSSLAALRDGSPADTTMGLTPAGGLMMGSRSGDLDPGVLLHLMREGRLAADEIDHLINHQSGLLGVSGSTSDMEELLERREADPRAELAVGLFCHLATRQIGALVAVLGGLDLLVFTGGIGENASAVREAIATRLQFLDFEIEVVATDENRVIADHVRRVAAIPSDGT